MEWLGYEIRDTVQVTMHLADSGTRTASGELVGARRAGVYWSIAFDMVDHDGGARQRLLAHMAEVKLEPFRALIPLGLAKPGEATHRRTLTGQKGSKSLRIPAAQRSRRAPGSIPGPGWSCAHSDQDCWA